MYNASAPGTTPRPRRMMSSRLSRAAAPTAASSEVCAKGAHVVHSREVAGRLDVVGEVDDLLQKAHAGIPYRVERDRPAHLPSTPRSSSSAAATGPCRIFLGSPSLDRADRDAVPLGGSQYLGVREFAAQVVQQARELGLVPRRPEPLRQGDGLRRHPVRVVAAARGETLVDERFRHCPVHAAHR